MVMKFNLRIDSIGHNLLFDDLKQLNAHLRGERIRHLAQLGLLVEQGKFPMFMPDQAAEQSLQAASAPPDHSDLKRRLASKLEGKF